MAFNAPSIGIFSPISAATLTLGPNDAEVGTKITKNGEDYVFVQNKGTTTANIGRAVIMSACSGYSVTVSSLTHANNCFGYVKHVQLNTLEYGWVLVRGFVDAFNGMTSTAPAAGDLVELAADGGFAKSNGLLATGAAAIPHGVVMSAGASGGTGASLSYLYVKGLG